MTKRSLTFYLLSVALGTVLLFITYFLFMDRVMIRGETPVQLSYKHFLLTVDVPGPRLIIDSGSNAHFGINSAMLEQHFGIFTVNTADNAGIAIDARARKLDRYARKGDVVLIPLEWNAYMIDGYTGAFVSNIFTSVAHYYNILPVKERIRLLSHIPPGATLANLHQIGAPHELSPDAQIAMLRDWRREHEEKPHGDILDRHRVIETPTRACDDYVHGMQEADISPQFMTALDVLKSMQDRGVIIFFTAPNVIGSTCYASDRKAFLEATLNIPDVIRSHGIPYVGDRELAHLPDGYLQNTFYHPTPAGRDLRTQRLINALDKVWPYENKSSPVSTDKLIGAYMDTLTSSLKETR